MIGSNDRYILFRNGSIVLSAGFDTIVIFTSPINTVWMEGQKRMCSACAGWVEECWSYCRDCGIRVPPRVAPLSPSRSLERSPLASPANPYANARASAKKGYRRHSKRNAASEDVRRQLQQVVHKPSLMASLTPHLFPERYCYDEII